MLTYATVVTAVLFFILGGIVMLSFEAWMDGRAIAARRHMAAKKREALLNNTLGEDTDAAMDQAVALVKEELGGQPILTVTKS